MTRQSHPSPSPIRVQRARRSSQEARLATLGTLGALPQSPSAQTPFSTPQQNSRCSPTPPAHASELEVPNRRQLVQQPTQLPAQQVSILGKLAVVSEQGLDAVELRDPFLEVRGDAELPLGRSKGG